MNNFRSNKKAFTLVELLIAISISLVFVAVFTSVLLKATESFYVLKEKSFFVNERRYAAQVMDRDMSYAGTLTSANAQSFTLTGENSVVTYTITQDTDGLYDIVRAEFDPLDLTTPIATQSVFSDMTGSGAAMPTFLYFNFSDVAQSIDPTSGLLSASQLTDTVTIQLTMERMYLRSKGVTSGSESYSFRLYDPTA